MEIKEYGISDESLLKDIDFDIICPSYEIISTPTKNESFKFIESVARICYQSYDRVTEDSSNKMIKNLCNRKHMPMFEFADIIVKFTGDRGFTHELRTHRLISAAQESTRYCDYQKKIRVIKPKEIIEKDDIDVWLNSMKHSINGYKILRKRGFKPEIARSVLPHCLVAQIIIKANFREWIHILNMRTSKFAHPMMRDLMNPLLCEIKNNISLIFDKIGEHNNE